MRKITLVSFMAVLSSVSWAIAATDNDLAEKCVVGWKLVVPSQVQFSYSAGGNVEGFKRTPFKVVAIKGTWELKNGVLSQHVVGDADRPQDSSFPIRVADDGTCMFKQNGKELPMQH